MSEPYWVPVSGAPGYYGTTPPASQQNGDLWYFPADVAAGIVWTFRYNAASASAYKWEFVGGPDFSPAILAGSTATSTVASWVDGSPVGPRIIVPRAGDYDAVGASGTSHTAAMATAYLGIALNAGTPVQQQVVSTGAIGLVSAHAPVTARVLGCAANDDIRLRYYNSTAGSASWHDRWLRVRPVRVS